ncbi:MAG: PilX N-terminal domain-containing pilus assembly protein, partial [Steroidobacteraceae bacterium]
MYRTRHAHPRPRGAQAGAALVIALIMLLILTILALAGVNTATTELTMAGNDQFRHSAMQAAAAGIEATLPQIGTVGTARDTVVTLARDELVPGSTDDRYTARARYIGEENGLPQSSADKFIGLHY